MTEIVPEIQDSELVRIIPRIGRGAVGANVAPPNPYAHLLDPEAMDNLGSVEDAAVRPVERPVDPDQANVKASVDTGIATTQNALDTSGGTESRFAKIPPK